MNQKESFLTETYENISITALESIWVLVIGFSWVAISVSLILTEPVKALRWKYSYTHRLKPKRDATKDV